jgi:hypothetical protein
MDLRLWKQREDICARWEKEVIMNFEKQSQKSTKTRINKNTNPEIINLIKNTNQNR